MTTTTDKTQIPAEELADDGSATGVELEPASDQIAEPFDPDEIKVTTRTMTVDLLMTRLADGVLNLQPDFQRKAGIWNDVKQSRLIESLVLRIPLPSFYVSENDEEEWEVVDGVQRLTAISRFVRPQSEDQALRLTGLEYLEGDFDRCRFEDLPLRLSRRIRETEFTFHVIESNTPPLVRFNIFARINTGGMPLTHQELRHALVPGKARVFLKLWAESESFQKAVDYGVKPDRMADREMVLRYFAFWNMPTPESYSRRDFGKFLMDAMKDMNKLSPGEEDEARDTFESAMRVARAVFGRQAFRKKYSTGEPWRKPINRALFESIAVNIANMTEEQQRQLVQRSDKVVSAFVGLMNEQDFEAAVSVATGDPHKVQLRFARIRRMLKGVLNA
ncbi:MAG: DUF262 domain-containing protein [Rhodospirillaceae bacterium]|nr:DUF262 domain-containing protein [Rhodospirillaceae bacterium]